MIDYKNEDVAKRVQEITNGKGVDLSLNPISGATVANDFDALAPLGTVILFGFLGGPPQGTFTEDLAKHFSKSIAVRVSDIYTYYQNQPKAFNKDLIEVFNLLDQKILKPHITEMPITEAAVAHRLLEQGTTIGKLVLTIE